MIKSLAFLILCCVASVVMADPRFGYRVHLENAPLFSEPSESSRVIDKLMVSQPIKGTVDDASHPGWVGIFRGNSTWGWVRRADLSTYRDLNPVKRCWPVRKVLPAEGESVFEWITFKSDGAARIKFVRDSRVAMGRTYINNELVGVSVQNGNNWLFFHFLPKLGELRPDGDIPTELVKVDQRDMLGCNGIGVSGR